jgi:hypothetical protein
MYTCTHLHTFIYTSINSYVSIHLSIGSIFLSIPPSIYLCFHTYTHMGEVFIRSYIRLCIHAHCRVCACAFRRRWTPLHNAARYGHADVVAALLAHGADVHAKDDQGGCGGPSLFLGNGRCAPHLPWPTGTGSMQWSSGRTDGHACDYLTHARASLWRSACAAPARTRAQPRAATHVRRRRPRTLRRTHTRLRT